MTQWMGNTLGVTAVDGIVYAQSDDQALDLKTGTPRWTWSVSKPGAAGAGRGATIYVDGTLYSATVGTVYALNPLSGALIGQKDIGGRFGIVSPTIVGGTMYRGNS